MVEGNELQDLVEKIQDSADEKQVERPDRLHLFVGVTIATLGVLLAFSTALVGDQRTELISSMVEQSNANTKFQSLSTKYRILIAQLQQLHSLTPDTETFKKWDQESNVLKGELSGDVGKLARMIRVENAKNLNAEIPTNTDLMHFVSQIRSLQKEHEASKAWTNSYDLAVSAHSTAGNRYDWAQLAAEIGIVVASIALLLSSRLAWFTSLGLGIATAIITVTTLVATNAQVGLATSKIEEARIHFESFNSDEKEKGADELLLKSIEETPPPTITP